MSARRNYKKVKNPLVRDKILARDGWQCVGCGSRENLTIDHIKPCSKGGYANTKNLQVLCSNCHCAKNGKDTMLPVIQTRVIERSRLMFQAINLGLVNGWKGAKKQFYYGQ